MQWGPPVLPHESEELQQAYQRDPMPKCRADAVINSCMPYLAESTILQTTVNTSEELQALGMNSEDEEEIEEAVEEDGGQVTEGSSYAMGHDLFEISPQSNKSVLVVKNGRAQCRGRTLW